MSTHRAATERPTLSRKQRIIGAIVGALILVGMAAPDRVAGHATIVPPCATEDAVPATGSCVWHAKAQGNQRGTSFIVTATGDVRYLTIGS